jgi:hypothetical protein
MPRSDSPVLMPVLSAGKHRSPRRGACFMEFASWLAGESWSDHPDCTHPAVAALARLVNDCTTDRGRAQLVELIPSVIGLVGDEPLAGVLVAARAARAALPVVSQDRQRALAAGMLCCERYLPKGGDIVSEQIRQLINHGLSSAPAAKDWAEEFSLGPPVPRPRDMTRVCTAALRVSVIGIAEACVDDSDTMLRTLLSCAIAEITATMPRQWADNPRKPILLQLS